MIERFERSLVAEMELVRVVATAIFLTQPGLHMPEMGRVLSAWLHQPEKIQYLKISLLLILHFLLQQLANGWAGKFRDAARENIV